MEKTITSKRGLRKAILESNVRHDILKYLDAGVATIDDIIEISVKAGYKTCLPDSVEECLSHEGLDAQETFTALKTRGLWEIIFLEGDVFQDAGIVLTPKESEAYEAGKYRNVSSDQEVREMSQLADLGIVELGPQPAGLIIQ